MKKLLTFIIVLAMAFGLFACSAKPEEQAGGASAEPAGAITDMLGRSVDIQALPERVVCIGAGSLRLYSYVGDLTKLVGVESCEYDFLISARPYQMINAELFNELPSIGTGGPQGAPNAEAILAVKPDIIFSTYTSDVAAMDQLSQVTGIPVVVLSYGETEAFDQAIKDSIKLLGDVTGRQERSAEVVQFIDDIQADLNRRTADIANIDKKSVYLGCQSNYGTHGIGSSSANYSLFDAVNARNILDENGYTGYQGSLELENIVKLNPDVIILDAGGLSIYEQEYAKNKAVFDSLDAYKSGRVYVQMPYNAYHTNLEIAYADAYYAGKVLFPTSFADVDMKTKFDEICTFLLGEGCYDEVTDVVGGGYRGLVTVECNTPT